MTDRLPVIVDELAGVDTARLDSITAPARLTGRYHPASVASDPRRPPAHTFRVFVPGTAAAQGSKRHVGHGRMVESSKKLDPWRARIVQFAYDHVQAGSPTFTGPVFVELTFYVARPRNHYGTGRNADTLKPAAPRHPTGRQHGDLDKLERAVYDALTEAGVIRDDADIVSNSDWKRWADDVPVSPGVDVTVRAMP